MLKTVGRLINLKTIFFVILYVILKRENKSFTTYEIKEESMSPELLPEDYVLATKTNEPPDNSAGWSSGVALVNTKGVEPSPCVVTT